MSKYQPKRVVNKDDLNLFLKVMAPKNNPNAFFHKKNNVIRHAKAYGMPKAEDFSVLHINATCEADLHLKVICAFGHLYHARRDGQITTPELRRYTTPLLNAINNEVAKKANKLVTNPTTAELTYPIQIKVSMKANYKK